MKLVPERSKFYETLALGNSTADMERFVTEFSPILAENHEFLVNIIGFSRFIFFYFVG